jgi:hypothetical protein
VLRDDAEDTEPISPMAETLVGAHVIAQLGGLNNGASP